ncbi:hypothetical protein [Psychrobacillus sp. OK032]|uniref:hypothetical protein n=1 Tax=Psychrobacillus sp. OK032 TaxID=1884358 RepID=UPI0008AB0CE0|nr:hypothetical protein [Psychrobacillus sp. OK032]SES16746.1 hypothetical protein SAMN05518872_10545 [Psychrobacillus sp. OK032]
MHWITIILIGIAANLDNLGIILAYGAKLTKIAIGSNIMIAFISMFLTYVAVFTGGAITVYISPSLANFAGSLLLCVMCYWFLVFMVQSIIQQVYLLTKTFIGKYSTVISGYLFIFIGVYEMFA